LMRRRFGACRSASLRPQTTIFQAEFDPNKPVEKEKVNRRCWRPSEVFLAPFFCCGGGCDVGE
ncbi:MAG: hypothetical protein AAGK78_02575, partial [Planctomycetota bacterium]